MGQATINSGGPNGLYNVKIVKDAGNASARQAAIASRLSALVGLISTATTNVNAALSDLAAAQSDLDAAIAAMVDETTRKAVTDATSNVINKQQAVTRARMVYAALVAEQQSIQKEQARLTTAMGDESLAAWCADLTENLAVGATVGTAEINGEDNQIIILPGGSTTNALGKLQHAGVATGAGVFYNKAVLPAWQKWKPTYRIGTIISVDYTNSKCDVGITHQYSSEQGLSINQAGVEWVNESDNIQGFDDFAAKYPDFPLVTNTADTTLTMTANLMRDMEAVQADVQNRFKYKLDKDQYGVLENWEFMQEGGAGDCEDHALTKAKKLLDLGYPASAIKIEVGNMPDGTGHAWLVVQTDQGDFVLDNNYQQVVRSSQIPYSARRRQTGQTWQQKGIKLSDVPIEYMDGVNADAFIVGDRVVVAFTNQNWNNPKVIGFETNPRGTEAVYPYGWIDPKTIRKTSSSGKVINAAFIAAATDMPPFISYVNKELYNLSSITAPNVLHIDVYDLTDGTLKRTVLCAVDGLTNGGGIESFSMYVNAAKYIFITMQFYNEAVGFHTYAGMWVFSPEGAVRGYRYNYGDRTGTGGGTPGTPGPPGGLPLQY